MPRIGLLMLPSADSAASLVQALKDGLRDLGYADDRNIAFERRYADDQLARLPDLASELVRAGVDVIVAGANAAIPALKRETATVPIVMVTAVDPVGAGYIVDLAHPGGNVTGLSIDTGREILGKNLGLLREVVPRLSRVGVIRQVESRGFAELQAAATKLGFRLEAVDIRTPEDIDGAFAAMNGKRVDAVTFLGGAILFARRQHIADLALKYRLPAVHLLNEYAHAGLLMSNGPSLRDNFWRAARYVARILKGEKPADLPVEQPTKFELVLNLRTAKALGLAIPAPVLLRADEVIQ